MAVVEVEGEVRNSSHKQPHQQESDENVKLRAVAKVVRLQMKEMLVLNSAHRNHHSQKDAVKKLIQSALKVFHLCGEIRSCINVSIRHPSTPDAFTQDYCNIRDYFTGSFYTGHSEVRYSPNHYKLLLILS